MDPTSFSVAQWLFIRLVGLIYLTAFGSLLVQIKGLWGKQGILPASDYLQNLKRYASSIYYQLPTLFWLNASDRFMQSIAILGMIVGGGLAFLPSAYFFPLYVSLALLWIFYYSFYAIGSVFLGFQWDILLLEVGFASIFFSLLTPPSSIWIGFFWFLLFRFMFSSGIVKWLSGCPEWRNFKAMDVHYETQPLPTRLAWYAHHLPKRWHQIETGAVFFIEVGVPFLIFFPDPFRAIGGFLLLFLQLLIIATGNYAFFNILSIAMILLLFDNSWFGGFFPSYPAIERGWFVQGVSGIVALSLFLVNILQWIHLLFERNSFCAPLLSIFHRYALCCPYGLFARMTTIRDELVLEGSQDGIHWQEYTFKWKPGNLLNPPRWVAPHQPRLDWQMWFASLGSYQNNPWIISFLKKVLEGNSDVLGLLDKNPFHESPPQYVRLLRYRYHFSDPSALKEKGEWWSRSPQGIYIPSVQLKDFI